VKDQTRSYYFCKIVNVGTEKKNSDSCLTITVQNEKLKLFSSSGDQCEKWKNLIEKLLNFTSNLTAVDRREIWFWEKFQEADRDKETLKWIFEKRRNS
jgi:hypothetical protein